MKFFSLGPVEMFPYTLKVASEQVPYFRTKEFSAIMLESETLMKKCIHAPDDSKVVFLTASGTAAMEATVFNIFNDKDKLLVIDGGIFGHRFVKICEAYKIPHDVISLKFGEVLTAEHLDTVRNNTYTGLLVNIHETSTGQLYDVKMLSDFCKEKGMYFIVDAISSFLADEYNVEKYGIDATIISSQKGLALGPGMSFVTLSKRIIDERVSKNVPLSLYFNFNEYFENQKRGQTPYTPAVRVAYELNDMLRHIVYEEGGIENRLSNLRADVEKFRLLLNDYNVDIPDYPISYAATPLLFNNTSYSADDVYNTLRYEHDITLTPCGGDLKNIMVRVGHIGYHPWSDYEILLDALTNVIGKR